MSGTTQRQRQYCNASPLGLPVVDAAIAEEYRSHRARLGFNDDAASPAGALFEGLRKAGVPEE
jgi:hypothetical protein